MFEMLPCLDEQELRIVFSFISFDKNNDGQINSSELKYMMDLVQPSYVDQYTYQDCIETINSGDSDGNGTMSYTEWRNFVQQI